MARSEYGGGAGANRYAPDGTLRRRTASEQRKAMFRAAHGLDNPDEAPDPDDDFPIAGEDPDDAPLQ